MEGDIYYIGVLGKTVEILAVFAREAKTWLTLREIVVASGLNKNTAFRILHTLAKHEYIEKESQAYRLGPALLALAEERRRGSDLIAVAAPFLDELRDRFGETVNLAVRDGGHVRYVDVRESRSNFRLAERIGGTDYLHSTAIGKTCLSFLPFEEVRQLMKRYGMARQTPRTIVTLAALKTELAQIQRQGFATDDQESVMGAYCIGVAIVDRNQAPVAYMSLSGPKARLGGRHVSTISRALMAAVAAVGSKLG
jgi:DNA-binding IclR family transcriptional regulator